MSTAQSAITLPRYNATRSSRVAIKAVQRGDPRRRVMSTAGAIAFSAFFFANCIMVVYSSTFHPKQTRMMSVSRNKARSDLSKIDYSWLRGGDIEQSDVFDVATKPTPPLEFAHGTTTLSFTFQGGIVAAVDSRAR